MMIADVHRAFFEAPAKRFLCAELPEETLSNGEAIAGIVGEPEASLYGTRDASADWQEEVNKSMCACCFVAGLCITRVHISTKERNRGV